MIFPIPLLQLRSDPGRAENTIDCPTSVYYSMALLAAGAGGATRDQILSALGLSGQSNDAFALQCQLLSCHTRQESEDSTFLTANSLWVRRGLTLQPDFGRIAAERFFAPVYAVDFADPATAGWMQDWVADNTKGLIRPSVQPDPDAALYLCNTIYLKGKWARPFFESSTSEGTFTQEDGTQITCDFMHDTRSSVFVRGSGYTRGDLEVRGIGTMSFLLPDEGVSRHPAPFSRPACRYAGPRGCIAHLGRIFHSRRWTLKATSPCASRWRPWEYAMHFTPTPLILALWLTMCRACMWAK